MARVQRRILTNDDVVANDLEAAAAAARRGDCNTALERLRQVPVKALSTEFADWRRRVSLLAKRCIRDVGLAGPALPARRRRR